MAYSRTHYGTGYFIYHQFLPGARPVAAVAGLERQNHPRRAKRWL